MNLIYAMGMDEILDSICFGKVLRLVTGDVVYWHNQHWWQTRPEYRCLIIITT